MCKHNCLATKDPAAAAQWDYEANAALGTPDTVVAHSHQPAGWHCQVCNHRWTASPNGRVSQQSGCSRCAVRGFVARQPTFADCQHPLLAEWDHMRNEICGNYAHKTTLKSSKQVFWLCNKCPAGKEHSWSAPAYSRTGHSQSGCPICAGHVACRCNSLPSLFPAVAAQWDYGRNTGQPSDYTARSHHLVWWCSPERGSWQQHQLAHRQTLFPGRSHGELVNSNRFWQLSLAEHACTSPSCRGCLACDQGFNFALLLLFYPDLLASHVWHICETCCNLQHSCCCNVDIGCIAAHERLCNHIINRFDAACAVAVVVPAFAGLKQHTTHCPAECQKAC